ncbi:hypothetical protein [Gordonia aichiensis]|nr:hypothetical protein [Gordonia aichiensis]
MRSTTTGGFAVECGRVLEEEELGINAFDGNTAHGRTADDNPER